MRRVALLALFALGPSAAAAQTKPPAKKPDPMAGMPGMPGMAPDTGKKKPAAGKPGAAMMRIAAARLPPRRLICLP